MWLFFFFSSRRRHTRLQGDWSSDVCSSDLADPVSAPPVAPIADPDTARIAVAPVPTGETGNILVVDDNAANRRSEERRVGKSVDLGGRRIIKKKKREDIMLVADTTVFVLLI